MTNLTGSFRRTRQGANNAGLSTIVHTMGNFIGERDGNGGYAVTRTPEKDLKPYVWRDRNRLFHIITDPEDGTERMERGPFPHLSPVSASNSASNSASVSASFGSPCWCGESHILPDPPS